MRTAVDSELPTGGRLLLFAVALPAAIVAANEAILRNTPGEILRTWFFPWLALCVGALGWSAGRYLRPTWFALVLFAWSLVLLDAITIRACLSGPISHEIGFAVIATQCAVLTIWSILAEAPWQHRLPAAMVACAILIAFAGIFENEEWSVLNCSTVVAMAVACVLLRQLGIRIGRNTGASAESNKPMQAHQFGTRQLLIWAAAMAPLLIVAKQIDYKTYFTYLRYGALNAALASSSIAVVALAAAWTALGKNRWPLWILVAVAIALMAAIGVNLYVNAIIRPSAYRGIWPRDALAYALLTLQDVAYSWFALLALMTAALLLFLRAKGYRLGRSGA